LAFTAHKHQEKHGDMAEVTTLADLAASRRGEVHVAVSKGTR